MDVADHDFFIYHRDLTMAYSPATHDLEASAQARTAIYTPYATWNTSDTDASAARSDAGRTAHADFMTSRLYADGAEEDRARLVIRHRETDHTVIEADLCNLLGQLRNYDETQRYSLQEFLDRAMTSASPSSCKVASGNTPKYPSASSAGASASRMYH